MGRIKMKQVEGIGNVTIEAAIEEFLKSCRLKNLSPKTIRYYEEDLQYFARNISAKNASEINRQIVDDFIFHEMNKGNRITAKPEGARTRGKRTIAKEKLYKTIQQEIAKIHPNFNIGVSTGAHGREYPHWNSPYEHWVFESQET